MANMEQAAVVLYVREEAVPVKIENSEKEIKFSGKKLQGKWEKMRMNSLRMY